MTSAAIRSSSGFSTLNGNRTYAFPITFGQKVRVQAMAVRSGGASGTSGCRMRMGIYAARADGMPGALVLDAGEVAITSNGVFSLSVDQVLEPGAYWLASFGGYPASYQNIQSLNFLQAGSMISADDGNPTDLNAIGGIQTTTGDFYNGTGSVPPLPASWAYAPSAPRGYPSAAPCVWLKAVAA